MFTKSLAPAAVLLFLASAATASTTALGTATVGTSLTFAGSATTAGLFQGDFTFFLVPNGGSRYDVSTFTLLGALYDTSLTRLSLHRNPDGIVGNADDISVASQGGGPGALSLTVGDNAGGNYFLRVVGTSNGSQGDMYMGAICVTAAAVPEPGTYALMFGGLGAVGVVASRRRSRV